MESTTNKKVVRHDGHKLPNGKTGKNHFQKKSGDGSHVFVETAKKGGVVAAATSNTEEIEDFATDAASFGATMTDAVENVGTNIFGDNDFGEMINEVNPFNLGFSDLFKSMSEYLSDDNSSNTSNSNNDNSTNTDTNSSETNTTSTENCNENECN